MRASWAGTLKIGGVSLPFKLQPALETAVNPKLKLICPEHKAPVEEVFQCSERFEYLRQSECGRARIIPSFQNGKPISIVIPIDVDSLDLEVEDGSVIEINDIRSVYDFDAAWVVKSYRCWTNNTTAPIFAALWRAMDRQQVAGYGSIVIAKRKYPAALCAIGTKQFVVHRMHWPEEMRPGVQITSARAEPAQVKGFDALLGAMRRSAHEPLFADLVNDRREKLVAEVQKREAEMSKQLLAQGLEVPA